jgi:hypothetical protein
MIAVSVSQPRSIRATISAWRRVMRHHPLSPCLLLIRALIVERLMSISNWRKGGRERIARGNLRLAADARRYTVPAHTAVYLSAPTLTIEGALYDFSA